MIGIIPRLWMSSVAQYHPAASTEAILAKSGFQPQYEFALDEVCNDEACLRLLHATTEVTGAPQSQLVEEFAQHFIADAAHRWPTWFAMSPTAKDFLQRQPRIHDSFRRSLNPEQARTNWHSKFVIEPTPNGLKVFYQSDNRLCDLYIALAKALIAHYQEQGVTFEHPTCMHQGHDHCDIHISWPSV